MADDDRVTQTNPDDGRDSDRDYTHGRGRSAGIYAAYIVGGALAIYGAYDIAKSIIDKYFSGPGEPEYILVAEQIPFGTDLETPNLREIFRMNQEGKTSEDIIFKVPYNGRTLPVEATDLTEEKLQEIVERFRGFDGINIQKHKPSGDAFSVAMRTESDTVHADNAPDTIYQKITGLTVPIDAVTFFDDMDWDLPGHEDAGVIDPDSVVEPNTRLIRYGDGGENPCVTNSRKAMRADEKARWKADVKQMENNAKAHMKQHRQQGKK